MAKDSGIGGALSSPTGWILAGGLVYIAYQIWKSAKPAADAAAEAAKNAAKVAAEALELPKSSLTPTGEPSTPSRTGVMTASVLDPPNNGSGNRDGVGANLRVKFAINNPGGYGRYVEVRVVVTWYFRVFGGQSATQSTKQVFVKAGRNSYDADIPVPYFVGTVDGVVEVFIDGKPVAVPSLFQLD